MADTRLFFKVTHGFTESNKITNVGGDAGWLHLCALDYCARNTTDGFFGANRVRFLSDRDDPDILTKRLLAEGLWHAEGHECVACPPCPAGMYQIHNYLEHQMSSYDVKKLSAERSAAGKNGASARTANLRKTQDASSKPEANVKQDGSKTEASVKQTSSKPEAEVEVDKEEELQTKVKTPTPRKRAVRKPPADQGTLPVPLPDPEVAARDKLAREILQWWWDQLEVKPAGKNAWHASLRVISNLLAVGHEAKAVANAARETGTPLTIARMEISLNRSKPSTNGHKPSTTDSRVAQALTLAELYQQRGE